MEEEKEEGGISLGDIFRTIFSQKWLALIIALVITLAGTLCIYFISNNSKREYTASFVLNLPGDDANGGNYVYPDGNVFYYSDIVSLDNLESVKEANSSFGNIDVTKMAKEGDITISRTRNQLSAENYESIYTINVKANYFSGEDVAREFISAIANQPGDHLTQMEIDYDGKIIAARAATDYENELGYLQDQVKYLIGQYEILAEEYKQDFVINEGKTLQNYLEEARAYVKNNTLSNLVTQAREGGYLKDNSLVAKYQVELIQAKKDLEDAEYTLQKMISATSDQTQNAEAIRVQSEKRNTLYRKVEYLTKYTSHTTADVPEAYKSAINAAYGEVEKFTEDFKQAASTVYGTAATVSFTTSNIIKTVGETGLVFSLLISLVVGIVVAAIVAYIVGRVRGKKAKKQEAAPENTEAAAQAAATDEEQK